MLNHDGFERYIGTYLLGILYLIVFVILDKLKNKSSNNLAYVILMAIIIIITPIDKIANATITSGIYNIKNEEYLYPQYKDSKYIKENVMQNDKILGICQRSELNLKNLIIRYYLYPNKYEIIGKIDENTKQLKQIIQEGNYNYIYVTYLDEYLKQATKEYFDNDNYIQEDTLYKIEKQNNIKLVEVK